MKCSTVYRLLSKESKDRNQVKLYKVMAASALCNGSELWTLPWEHEQWLHSSEIRFLRKVKCCTLRNWIRNEDIRDLGIFSLNTELNDIEKIGSHTGSGW